MGISDKTKARAKRMLIEHQESSDKIYKRVCEQHEFEFPKPVWDRIFSYAWEYGHSGGDSEMESYAFDLADVAKMCLESEG